MKKSDLNNFKEPCVVAYEGRKFNDAYIGSPFDGSMVKIEFEFGYVKPPKVKFMKGLNKILKKHGFKGLK